MSFIHDDFLLQGDSARVLYHEYAKDEPIFDYHCHLPPEDVARNRRFGNLAEIWLEGDHYKWRAMRANGLPEEVITGSADPYDKFVAWCRTVPHTLRNPLYHWSHLELKRYFGIDLLINEETAPEIWETANAKLATDAFSARGILESFRVKVVGTTDDPSDDLAHHKAIRESGIETVVVPTFRPDGALNVDDPAAFNAWVGNLSSAAGIEIHSLEDLLSALRQRHDFFHEMGCRLSDHGIQRCFYAESNHAQAGYVFQKARSGIPANEAEKEKYGFYLMRELARWNSEKGWVMQLHVGAMRDANTRQHQAMGRNVGYDSIGDYPQVTAMRGFLDSLERSGDLPKVVAYNLNPRDNYAIASMLGCFQGGGVAGKMQLGSGWWFLDQKEGMEAQINALSNIGLISRFVGMLTDSRSFLSYPRHEYFRRVLCNMLGGDMDRGEIPRDFELVGEMARRICFANAAEYFGIELSQSR